MDEEVAKKAALDESIARSIGLSEGEMHVIL